MTEGPQKFFLTCPECNDRVLIVIPADPEDRQERMTACPKGHAISYDERVLLEPAVTTGSDAKGRP